MIYYLDASALAKRYLLENGTERIRQLFWRGVGIAVSRISEVEVASALVRRMNAGDLDEVAVADHLATLAEDLNACEVVEVRKPVIATACELVREHGLRAYDAMQLAGALRIKGAGALTFLCADGELADAVKAERLPVERLG